MHQIFLSWVLLTFGAHFQMDSIDNVKCNLFVSVEKISLNCILSFCGKEMMKKNFFELSPKIRYLLQHTNRIGTAEKAFQKWPILSDNYQNDHKNKGTNNCIVCIREDLWGIFFWHLCSITSQELRMLSRSVSDCQSLTLNVMIQVS